MHATPSMTLCLYILILKRLYTRLPFLDETGLGTLELVVAVGDSCGVRAAESSLASLAPPRCELFIHVGHEQAGGTAVCLEYEEEEEHQHHGRLGADGRARTRREEGGNLVSASLWDCISCKLNEMLL